MQSWIHCSDGAKVEMVEEQWDLDILGLKCEELLEKNGYNIKKVWTFALKLLWRVTRKPDFFNSRIATQPHTTF